MPTIKGDKAHRPEVRRRKRDRDAKADKPAASTGRRRASTATESTSSPAPASTPSPACRGVLVGECFVEQGRRDSAMPESR